MAAHPSPIDRLAPGSLGLRPPEEVVSLAALGATKAYRLSFARTLVRRMLRERWRIEQRRFDIDDHGVGTVIYDIEANGHELHFLAFSDEVHEGRRTGRLSQSRFDGMGVVCHGELTPERIAREHEQLQKRSLGRTDWETIGWTLANRSSRSFWYVVNALRDGRQPDPRVMEGGARYLFRNAGYYGNGRHGTRMWESLPDEHPLSRPYHPELFGLYLWRQFGFDLAEALARRRSSKAVALDPRIKRYLGVGNNTAQGVSTFIVKWPRWMHAWTLIRETAIAIARAEPVSPPHLERARTLLDRCRAHMALGPPRDDGFFLPYRQIVHDLDGIRHHLAGLVANASPWGTVCDWVTPHVHRESLELLHSVLTEVHAARIDPLDGWFREAMRERADVAPHASVGELRSLMRDAYAWTFEVDLDDPATTRHFFYRSEEHGEQRRAERGIDDGEAFETFTTLAMAIRRLDTDLAAARQDDTVALFLLHHPEHRFIVERVQTFAHERYAEIRTNVPGADFLPCHAIRFMLATFGMETFTAYNHRWVQGTFFDGAPTADGLAQGGDDDWLYPITPGLDA